MSEFFGLSRQVSDPKFLEQITIPHEGYEPPLDTVIDFFNHFSFLNGYIPQNELEAQVLARECVYPWHIKLHGLYKLSIDTGHKVPGKRNVVRYFMHQATVLNCLRELCKEAHFRFGKHTIYPDGATWFGAVIADQIHLDAKLALTKARRGERGIYLKSWEGCPNAQAGAKHSKKGMMQIRRQHWVKKLQANESPFEDTDEWQHWRQLIEMSMEFADKNALKIDRSNKRNVFRNKLWLPYLRAESAALTAWKKDKDAVDSWIENGGYFRQAGKGRGKVKAN